MDYLGEDMFDDELDGDDDDVLLGDDEILGQDDLLDDLLGADDYMVLADDEILGADPRRAARRAAKRAALAARKRALARRVASRNARVVAAKKPRGVQTQVLAFPATLVAASGTQAIQVRPQRTFRTERLVVASAISALFQINDLEIGRESMLVSSGGVPAQVFSEVGVGVRLLGYTANLGNEITINVTNLDVVNPQTFRGAIIGSTVINP